MQITSLFRIVLISSLVAAIVGIVAGINLTDTLPVVLQNYLIQIENEEMSGLEAIITIIALVALLIILPISTIGLWKFKSWARTLFVTLSIITIPFYPILGPVVMNSWEAVFNDLAVLLEGVLIAMMFFGPISEKFKSTSVVSS